MGGLPMHPRTLFKYAGGAALAAGLLGGGAVAQERLTMGATHSASSFYAYQVGISNFLNNAVEDVNINVRELGGAEVSTEALLRDEVDMGIAVTSSDYAALQGDDPFGEPAEELRTLYYFAPLPLNFVVAADSDVQGLQDLEGQEFNPGGRGTSTERQVDEILNALEIEPELMRAEGSDALDAYQNRQIVGFVKGGSHPDGYIQQAHSAREIRVLPFSEEQQSAIAEAFPYFSATTVDPESAYGAGGTDVPTVQTAIGINATAGMDEETAYQIAKAVFSEEGQEAANAAYPAGEGIDLVDLTLRAAVAPLHAGVIRYLEEAGHEVPERLIPQQG